jgi:cyclopropane fatty-acyl-phospholipid synthase-like methyltransferase
MSLQGYLTTIFNKRDIHIDEKLLLDIIRKHRVKEWFYYAQFKDRQNYWNSWQASFFLARHLSSSAVILETGCGMGLNLFWFHQHGFKNTYGIDIESNFIDAGKELSEILKVNTRLSVDNCLHPVTPLPKTYDALIALNWTYHDGNYNLPDFLHTYLGNLRRGGYICIDVVDKSYNQQPNNQYLTSDWNKPEEQRQPTEYKVRYSEEEADSIFREFGLRLIKRITKESRVPKVLYILKK